jgi:hypothetical protein
VPSSARRTLVIGLLALGPLLVLAPLFFPSEHLIAGIPYRRLVRVTIFGFGIATLAITTVTSHLTYRLRRSMRSAMKLGTAREIPPDLEAVLMACLRKEPEHRYPDGRSLLRALEACVGDPSWSMEEADLWWRAWSSGAAAPPALLEMACPTATRRELGPVSTRPFALRSR